MKLHLLGFYLCFSVSIMAQPSILPLDSLEEVKINRVLLADSIRAIVAEGIRAAAFPGANVLVAKEGKIVFHESYGFWTYDSIRAVEKTDIYDYASITKISATLPVLMKLHGEGKFDLDAPLKQYLPMMRWSNKAKLSFRTMLAHQAGLQPGIVHWRRTLKKNGAFKRRTFVRDSSEKYPIRIVDDLWLHKNYTKKMFKAIKKSELNESPSYRYSGLIFYLLPTIIESIVEEDFETYLKREFYQKINASTITFNPTAHFPLERIVPTELDTFFRHTQVHGVVHDEGAGMMGGVSGNAGLFSTIEDLAKLAQLYLNEGYVNGEQLFAKSSIREFTAYQYPELNNRRGLGFDKPLLKYDALKSYVAQSASPASYGHSGYTGTFIWIDPTYDLIFILFSNRVYPDRSHRNLYELNIRPRLHQAVYEALE